MILTLISSALGFLGAAVPDLIGIYKNKQDSAHELAVLELQLKQQSQGHTQRLEEIHVEADISETKAIYKTYNTGVRWVDALNGTVRPVLAYGFFTLYVGVKVAQVQLLGTADLGIILEHVWTLEDQAIFAGIISFYFGQRAMAKVRKGL